MDKKIYFTPVAVSIPFDNSTNGFVSTNVQAAIEETGVFGSNQQSVVAPNETSTSSQTVWSNKLTLTTPNLPLGDYRMDFQFLWRSSNANRALDIRIQRNGVDLISWSPFINSVNEQQLLAGFQRVLQISGVNTFTLDFKVGTSNTVYMSDAKFFFWRIA